MSQQLSIEDAVELRNSVLALIAIDPKVHAHIREIAETIDRLCKPGDHVSANLIRPHLPTWINTTAIGPAFGLLTRRGALHRIGYVTSTDPGTHGKPIAVYRVASPAAEVAA